MAQAVYIAQLFAAKGTCKCPACRALRTASDAMLAPYTTAPVKPAIPALADAGLTLDAGETEG